MVREEGRRKVYQLTPKGREVLLAQRDRLEMMIALYDENIDPDKEK